MIPTEPGYYWRYGPNHDGEQVEQVVKVDIMSVHSEDLFYWEAGNLGGIYIQEEPGVEWEKTTPPVQFAHFWTCPSCGATVPAYQMYCFHGRAETSTNVETV